jgi:hypothetical protein
MPRPARTKNHAMKLGCLGVRKRKHRRVATWFFSSPPRTRLAEKKSARSTTMRVCFFLPPHINTFLLSTLLPFINSGSQKRYQKSYPETPWLAVCLRTLTSQNCGRNKISLRGRVRVTLFKMLFELWRIQKALQYIGCSRVVAGFNISKRSRPLCMDFVWLALLKQLTKAIHEELLGRSGLETSAEFPNDSRA